MELSDGETQVVDKVFGYKHSLVNEIVYPPGMSEKALEKCQNELKLKPRDIIIATYPKCGTTLMQQVVLTLLHNGDGSRVKDPMNQSPWIEMKMKMGITAEELNEWDGSSEIDGEINPTGRRVFKTHAPANLLPWMHQEKVFENGSGNKAIVVYRNPKDAAISMYHHARDVPFFDYSGNLHHFINELYLKGKVESGNFWEFYAGWEKMAQRNQANILLISFEEMVLNPLDSIRKVAEFLNLDFSEDILLKTAEVCSFSQMKKNFAETDSQKKELGMSVKKNHIRKGKIGNWQTELQEEDNQTFDIAHEMFSTESGLTLPFQFTA